MGDKTAIPYCDATWNPMIGCSRVSKGCEHCYAERLAGTRLISAPAYQGLTVDGKWTGEVRTFHDRLGQPTRWKRPRVIFGCDMGDLFHVSVPLEFIAAVFAVAAMASQHTFLFLTKRVERAAEFYRWLEGSPSADPLLRLERAAADQGVITEYGARRNWTWPIPNLWLGATVESQGYIDRIAQLAAIESVAHRWLSLEPMLGRIEIPWSGVIPGVAGYAPAHTRIECAVVGGESGLDARQCKIEDIRKVVDDCKDFGVTPYVKQFGSRPILDKPSDAAYAKGQTGALWPGGRRFAHRAAADPEEWPLDLRRYRVAPWSREAQAQ